MWTNNKKVLPLYILDENQSHATSVYMENIPNIANKSTHLCIAVSTGIDSMFMLYSIHTYFVHAWFSLDRISVLHYHHQQRALSEDEFFSLKNHCIYYWIRFISASYYDVEKKEITENTMRKSRYSFFDTYVENLSYIHKENYSRYILCLWHHLDDRIETTYMNMQRGSSLQGIINMNYSVLKRNLLWSLYIYARPLLGISKHIIQTRTEKLDISFFTDVTNFDENVSQRNELRNNVLWQIFDEQIFKKSRKKTYTKLLSFMTEVDNLSDFYSYQCCVPIFWEEVLDLMYIQWIKQPYNVIQLFKNMNIYRNMSTWKVFEFYTFFTKETWWKRLWNWIFYNVHWEIYWIQYTKKYLYSDDANLALPLISKEKKENYYNNLIINKNILDDEFLIGSRDLKIHGKSYSKRCINKKIPYFLRDSILLKRDDKSKYQLFIPRSQLIKHK